MTLTSARSGPIGQLAGALAVAVATAVTWWSWLGWDNEYQVDPVTGDASGPYQPWQVVGCGLTLIAIAVVGGLTLWPWIPPVVLTLTFTGVWSRWAGSADETGLWVVGAGLLFVGLAVGSTIVTTVAWGARGHQAPA